MTYQTTTLLPPAAPDGEYLMRDTTSHPPALAPGYTTSKAGGSLMQAAQPRFSFDLTRPRQHYINVFFFLLRSFGY